MMVVWKDFSFEAAHFLPRLPPTHKCFAVHGHSYRFRLEVSGPIDPTLGWVSDFGGTMKAAGDLLVGILDHKLLNDIDGLDNPTAERLAVWVWDRVSLTNLNLSAVEVYETPKVGVRYTGP